MDIQTKDGIILRNIPEGTPEEAIKARLAKIRQERGIRKNQPNELELANPTDGMSGLDKFRAGIGKAFVDLGRGVGQIAGVVDQKDVDEAKRLDSSLMDTGAGFAGNLVGNLVPAAATAAIPGANTVVGGAALSGVLGALQPVGSTDSRLGNAALSTILGGTIPAATRLYGATKAAVIDPFSSAGRDRIAGGVMRDVAADPDAAFQNLINAQGKTAGFMPTAGQAANDAGIATLERTARAIDPGGYDDVLASQRKSLADAVRGLGGDDVTRARLVKSRDDAVESLYTTAKSAMVNSDPELNSILNTPAGKYAAQIANQKFSNLRQPSMIRGTPESAGKIVGPDGNPLMVFDEIPEQYKGAWLHEVKMALDKLANINPSQSSDVSQLAGVQEVRSVFNDWLENSLKDYGKAKNTYSAMSQPINSMDVGNALGEKFIPALYRDMDAPLSLNYDALARAVRNNGDDIARNVTGYKKATLGGTLGGKEMKVLNDVLSDAEMVKMGELLGKGGGSDTIQKMAMSNVLNKAGVPTFMQDLAMTGWVKRAGDLLYGNADEQVRNRLAEALRNPKEAAQLMKAAGVAPSKIAQALKALSSAAQAPMFALPAIMNAE